MPIRQLDVKGVRNLAPTSIQAHPSVNFIFGDNGSGKTSLLESIYLLSSGRSFRTSRVKTIFNNDLEKLELAVTLDDSSLIESIRLKNGDQLARLDGKVLSSQAKLASFLPVQIIDPGSFKLLIGSPEDRRQFLDWGVFYHSSEFIDQWKSFRSLLKQRNKALKDGDSDSLSLWNSAYIEVCETIDLLRRDYFSLLSDTFKTTVERLDPSLSAINLDYFRGWDRSSSLESVLDKQLERDCSLGFTQSGPHRAELRILFNKTLASEFLSRGQQKSVVSAMKFAQGLVFKVSTGVSPIFLVDDLSSELDKDHRLSLCEMLEDLKCQVFITSIEKEQIFDYWKPTHYKMFHVKHGLVEEVASV